MFIYVLNFPCIGSNYCRVMFNPSSLLLQGAANGGCRWYGEVKQLAPCLCWPRFPSCPSPKPLFPPQPLLPAPSTYLVLHQQAAS